MGWQTRGVLAGCGATGRWGVTMLLFSWLGIALAQGPQSMDALQLDCVIEPHRVVKVSSSALGVLEAVLVERNQQVEAGQLLARLQSGVEQASLELARTRAQATEKLRDRETRYQLALRSQQRVEGLVGQQMVSDSDLDEARTKSELARLEVEQARLEHVIDQLEQTRAEEALKLRLIHSPVDGVVVERFKSAGEYLDQTPVLELAQVDPLNVEAIAPVALFGRIRQGMTGRVLPEAPIGGDYPAQVTIVDQVLDAASGTFGIRLLLPNPENRIPAGLGCQVVFAVDGTAPPN